MNEPTSPIEARLASLKLRPVPPWLQHEIAQAVTARARSRFDWPLWGAIASGAVAACVIVGTLLAGPLVQPTRSAVRHQFQNSRPAAEQALASASPSWGDELNQFQDRRFP